MPPAKPRRLARCLWVPVFGFLVLGNVLLHTRLISWLPSSLSGNDHGNTFTAVPQKPWDARSIDSTLSAFLHSSSKNSASSHVSVPFLTSLATPVYINDPTENSPSHRRQEERLEEKDNLSVTPSSTSARLSLPLESLQQTISGSAIRNNDNPSASLPEVPKHSHNQTQTEQFVLPQLDQTRQHAKVYSKTTMDDPSVRTLRKQGFNVSESQLSDIPSWEQVTDIFGTEPVILGLETCEAYRQAVPLENRTVLPSGLFNTGTNLFPEFFNKNCDGDFQKGILQVNWGKHNLADARVDHFTINRTKYQEVLSEHILPVVMVRHPVSWMFSTCLHSYGARWTHNQRNCPHIVHENKTGHKSLVRLRVSYGYNRHGGKHTAYPSLIHFWREWIHSYHAPELPFPRLIIRLEDVVYRPDAVLQKICECAGGQQRYGNVYVPEESVKLKKDRWRQEQNLTGSLAHGKETAGLLTAWSKHASIASLWQKIKPEDQQVIKQVLLQEDTQDLLRTLHYNLEGTSSTPI